MRSSTWSDGGYTFHFSLGLQFFFSFAFLPVIRVVIKTSMGRIKNVGSLVVVYLLSVFVRSWLGQCSMSLLEVILGELLWERLVSWVEQGRWMSDVLEILARAIIQDFYDVGVNIWCSWSGCKDHYKGSLWLHFLWFLCFVADLCLFVLMIRPKWYSPNIFKIQTSLASWNSRIGHL